VLCLCLCNSVARCDGSTLDKFEKSVTKVESPKHDDDDKDKDKDKDHDKDHKHGDHHDHDAAPQQHHDDDGPMDRVMAGIGEGMFRALIMGMGYGGQHSLNRMLALDDRSLGAMPRYPGEPLIPMARFDLDSRKVGLTIDALDLRSEIGYGPVALQYNSSRYTERDPRDSMTISQIYGLYRMSFGSHVETDIGLGSLNIAGNDTTSRFSVAVPVLIYPNKHLGIEFRPAWADRVQDYDLAVVGTARFLSIKAGYRWVESPRVTLNGAYVGMSLRL